MPSHFGHATYMLKIANLLHDKCGCEVMDILSSPYHEPWYDTKMKNGINAAMNYEFSVSNQDSTPNKIYIIDNVYSSGKTMNNAIAKIKSVFPESNVDGLVIGYVDQETIKQLHYNENLHEAVSPRFPSGSKYEQYCRQNITQFESLIVSFLKNTEEGEKLYQPWIRCHGTTPDGKNYLRFERTMDVNRGGKYKILSNGSQLIDFNYINQVLRLFLAINDKFSSSFEYSNDGKLEYVIRLIEKLKKDTNGNPIMSNGHPISKKGQQVFRYGKVKSPVGIYTPHNHNKLSTTKSKFGNKWNKYFNPEYYVYNAQGQVTGFERSNQTGDGQFPVHWFPKNDNDARVNLPLLAKLIASAFRQINNNHSEALFIAFLKLIDRKEINGYKAINSNKEALIMMCEREIDGKKTDEPKPTYSNGYIKPQKQYKTNDDIHYFDNNGQSSDEDMEYQINHLGLESIIKNVINKLML